MVWDSDENIATIHERVCALTKGCKCVTGCTSKRCSCCRGGKTCSAGCECKNCNNVPTSTRTPHLTLDSSSQLVDVTVEEEYQNEHNGIEDIMDFVFGEYEPPTETDIDSDSEPEDTQTNGL